MYVIYTLYINIQHVLYTWSNIVTEQVRPSDSHLYFLVLKQQKNIEILSGTTSRPFDTTFQSLFGNHNLIIIL